MHTISTAIFGLTAALAVAVFINSCTTPKDARTLKRATKEWRQSPIVMHAWADTPLSGVFLTLRENKKFEHTSSGLVQSFEAGTWTNSHDTIRLVYLDSKQSTIRNQNVIIDRQTSTLIFEGDSTPVRMRLRIMTNKL